ncbi:glycosyltransferase family 4 protein [Bradyrhizobium sp.]|uniref:glycosyltransferase family 4 protein n=1 Tax=Bradyrhizobium sp. TaxID=376 RepID=UPI000AAA9F60|nr:glycosyltransferase family 4 protein [Bradyrhizobium sp.]
MQDPAPNVMFLVEVVNCNDGIASYCETLATGLHGRGVQIHLVSGAVRSDDKSEYKRQKLAAAVKEWHVIPGLRKLPSLSIFMQLLKLIRKNNITVINVHGLGMLMWGRLLALLTGARCVATYHPSVLGNIEKVQNAPQPPYFRSGRVQVVLARQLRAVTKRASFAAPTGR